MLTTTDTLQHKDTSIWVFAEGTRNLGKGLLPFKKGAFQMAIAAGVPIIPVCVSTYANRLKINSWSSGKVLIRSLPAIPTLGLTLDDLPQLMERCQQMMRESIEQLDLQLTKA